MRRSLDNILSKFPSHRTRIIDLYNWNEDFRILCEDYMTTEELAEETKLKHPQNPAIENEFLQLNKELEKEIRKFLRM